MSFETLHTGNWEEALLLYVDDALSAEERAAVEAYVQARPELAPELDALLRTRLPAEDVVMPGKEYLFSDTMMALGLEDSLGEDDLPRLPADEPLPAFPWKESLYRTEAPVRRLTPVYRAAAAAAVVLLLAGGWWTLEESTVDGPQSTVERPQMLTKNAKPAIDNKQSVDRGPSTVDRGPSTVDRRPSTVDRGPVSNGHAYAKTEPAKTVSAAVSRPSPVSLPEPIRTTAQEIPFLNHSAVTNTAVAPLNDQTTAQTPTYAVQTDTEDPGPAGRRGGSLKGLLRKATRIIEARTGIETVNEDGELLIGVVAVKLD